MIERREILKWTTPVVMAVVLPIHAQTTGPDVHEVPPEPPIEPPVPPIEPPIEPPVPPPESECKEGKTLICHHPDKDGPGELIATPYNRKAREPFEICVGNAAVPAHIKNHGDYIGACK